MSYLDLLNLAAPETLVVVTAFAVLVADLLALRDLAPPTRRLMGAGIGSLGCLAAIVWMLLAPAAGDIAEGMLVVTPLTQLVKIALLSLALCTLILGIDADFTVHVGEYLALLLLGAVGMMFLVSAQNILMIFLALELTSLSLYILAGFDKRSPQSAEAALKYFLFGGMSAAFTLFGFSLLYGLAGSTHLPQIAAAIHSMRPDPLLLLAMVMVAVGFGFKVAAAPFHLWAPDAYQGAPIPSAAFIASGSKVAGFFILAQVMMLGFVGAEGGVFGPNRGPGWVPLITMLAVLSMVLGNLAALAQTSVRRLLAYSAVAHAGYALLGVLGHRDESLAALVYYVVTYAATVLGAFGVVSIVHQHTGGDRLADFAGLSRRAPLLATCMLVFLLSLAGIPPLAGFFGKFYLFATLLGADPEQLRQLWLVILAIAMSAVSLYYYLQVLKRIFVTAPPAPITPMRIPVVSQMLVVLLALMVLLLGCAPNLLLDPIARAIHDAAVVH